MSAPALLHWRRALPPPEPEPPAPVYDFRPLGGCEGRAPSRDPRDPDELVFGKPYMPRELPVPEGWRARSCGCGARWHGDGDTRCWACGETAC